MLRLRAAAYTRFAFFVGVPDLVLVTGGVFDFDGVLVRVADLVAVLDAVGVLVAVSDAVGVLLPVCDAVGVRVGVDAAVDVDVAAADTVTAALGVTVGVLTGGDAVGEPVGAIDTDAAAVTEPVRDGVPDFVAECVSGREALRECVGCAVSDADADGDIVPDGDDDDDDDTDAVIECVAAAVAVADGDAVPVAAAEEVAAGVVERVLVGDRVPVRVCVPPAVIDADALAEGDAVGVAGAVAVVDGEGVAVCVPVRVVVRLDVGVLVVDGVVVPVCVCVRVGLLDGDTTYCTASSLKLKATCAAVSAALYTRTVPTATLPPSIVPRKLYAPSSTWLAAVMESVRVAVTALTAPLTYTVSGPVPPAYVTTTCVQALASGV